MGRHLDQRVCITMHCRSWSTFAHAYSWILMYSSHHICIHRLTAAVKMYNYHISLLAQPNSKTHFAGHSFHLSAPAAWNSLSRIVPDSLSLTVFKSRLNTYLFHMTYNNTCALHCGIHKLTWLPPHLELRTYGRI